MVRRILVTVAAIACLASPALAQGRVEISGMAGGTFSDGVSFASTTIVSGVVYSRSEPKDSWSLAGTIGFHLSPQVELGFQWLRQPTTVEVWGTGGSTLSGDLKIDNYHGEFIYDAGPADGRMRPFLSIGGGFTRYSDAVFEGKTIPGTSKFSLAFGAGFKGWASPNVGFKVQVRWVPTYLGKDSRGWWCDAAWGCTGLERSDYSNQLQLTGGIVARF